MKKKELIERLKKLSKHALTADEYQQGKKHGSVARELDSIKTCVRRLLDDIEYRDN